MKAKVQEDLCIGCGLCVNTCEDVFDFSDKGTACVVVETISDEFKELVEMASEGCPTSAIKIENQN